MNVSLADGRAIYMTYLEQAFTYAGVLCGRFTTEDNDRRIEELIAEFQQRLPCVGEPVVLAPERVLVPARRERNVPEGERLPAVCSMAHFRSNSPARDPGEAYSSVAVVWFQSSFGLPDERALLALRNIDWFAAATDWTP